MTVRTSRRWLRPWPAPAHGSEIGPRFRCGLPARRRTASTRDGPAGGGSRRPAWSGVRSPLRALHRSQAATQLVQLDAPPCDWGRTWSGQESGTGTGKRDRSEESGTGPLLGKRDRKAGQVRYWQYGLAGNSPNLAKSDPSRFSASPGPSGLRQTPSFRRVRKYSWSSYGILHLSPSYRHWQILPRKIPFSPTLAPAGWSCYKPVTLSWDARPAICYLFLAWAGIGWDWFPPSHYADRRPGAGGWRTTANRASMNLSLR